MVEFVYFAHGVVEDAGDDAAVGVAGRSGVALAEAEVADESLALLVEDELQAHAVGIVLSTDEAVVFLHLHVAGVVALGLRLGWHGGILRDSGEGLKIEIPHLAKEARCGAPGRDGDCELHRSSLPLDERWGAFQMRPDAVYISVLESFGLELS